MSRKLIDYLLRRVLSGPCTEWPRCTCARTWNEAEATFEAWKQTTGPIPAEQIDALQLKITCVLHCVATHCPDKQARQHATIQLLHPIFRIKTGGA